MDDTETIHPIKTMHLPANTGPLSETKADKTDFAVIELIREVNACSSQEIAAGRCWTVTPVKLPNIDISIENAELVRTLGNLVVWH